MGGGGGDDDGTLLHRNKDLSTSGRLLQKPVFDDEHSNGK